MLEKQNVASSAAPNATRHTAPMEKSMPLYRFCQVVVRGHLKFWHQLRVEGLEHVPATGGVILAANHLSHIDPPLLGCSFPRPIHYLAKEELFRQPILRWFLPQIGQVPVSREAGGGLALKTGIKLLRDGMVLGVFPEGTRSKTGQRQSPRTGVVVLASMGNAPILPTYIYGTFDAMPPGAKALIPGKKVGVRFGEPFYLTPEQADLKDREAMETTAEYVMDRIFALKTDTT